MSAATMMNREDTMTPALFDLDTELADLLAETAREADRELCKRYLGKWADTYGSGEQTEPVTFAEFRAAAERLSAAAA